MPYISGKKSLFNLIFSEFRKLSYSAITVCWSVCKALNRDRWIKLTPSPLEIFYPTPKNLKTSQNIRQGVDIGLFITLIPKIFFLPYQPS